MTTKVVYYDTKNEKQEKTILDGETGSFTLFRDRKLIIKDVPVYSHAEISIDGSVGNYFAIEGTTFTLNDGGTIDYYPPANKERR